MFVVQLVIIRERDSDGSSELKVYFKHRVWFTTPHYGNHNPPYLSEG